MGEVIHGTFDKNKEGGTASTDTTPSGFTSDFMEKLFKANPSRYYYIQGKKAEIVLDFDNATEYYMAAYSCAAKEGLSCAMRYKHNAMRAAEYDGIFYNLKQQVKKAEGKGKLINDHTILTHYMREEKVIPVDLFRAARNKVPTGFPYNLVQWDKKENTITFIHAEGLFTDSEPTIGRSYTVFKNGNCVSQQYNPNPDIILDKWMLVEEGKFPTFDMKAAVRRSIKIRYLNIPEPLKLVMEKKKVFEKYIAPRIGNRNIGYLFSDFVRDTSA